MKLSLKFREDTPTQTPLLRAKIPVTILNLPFTTAITAGDSSDLSFSLRSNFPTGPSLSLSYHPSPSSSPQRIPFSLSLKSGTSLFGSPHNSPLIFTATFTPNNNNLNGSSSFAPAFSLQVKPQFGSFSLFKKVSSEGHSPNGSNGYCLNGEMASGSKSDFEMGDGSVHGLETVKLGEKSDSFGFLKGVFVAARTHVPVTRRAVVNFRWGVSFPSCEEGGGKREGFGLGSRARAVLPGLVVNKVSLERVEEVKEEKRERKGDEVAGREVEVLKGVCGWMRREMEELQRENREIKKVLEGLRGQAPALRESGGKRGVAVGSGDSGSEFDRWRSKKGGGNGNLNAGGGSGNDESGSKEVKKGSSSRASEVESELQKAIKAASSS